MWCAQCSDCTNRCHKAGWRKACSTWCTFACLRSTDVLTVWTCTQKICEQTAKVSNDSTCSKRGARARSILIVNVRHLHGPRPSQHFTTKKFPTTFTSRREHNSAKKI